ncbi:uncharacterized protein LOC125549495 isoform X2 [Triticum urartu]|uniref:uncharacterized protein LOC125549495 isoform X2 n=1 Tax=Triticum urartu TaxID=4572 RepID=UPI002044BE4F|nr:uncharacterized protein LOC125549495 isoform X2 [Triticum urartu]
MKKYSKLLVVLWMFLLLLISTGDSTKSVIKFIKSEDGDIIECVDIYQQPSFEHLVIKNDTKFEMQQMFSTNNKKTNATTSAVVHQIWQKSGNCPSGTIPIRRMTNKSHVELEQEQLTACKIEFAGIETYQTVYGARADINAWSINVEPNEWSVSAINIYNENGSYIQYGWMDPPRGIDCFNLKCNGFVQISNEYAFGAALTPLSEFGGGQTEIQLTLYKDEITGRWCVMYNDRLLGYWPREQFPQFENGVAAFWGGQLCNMHTGNRYTTTEMGSGSLPSEGYGKSAYIHGLEVMDMGQNWNRPLELYQNLSSDCYKVETFKTRDGKVSAYFGGTASIKCCGMYCE